MDLVRSDTQQLDIGPPCNMGYPTGSASCVAQETRGSGLSAKIARGASRSGLGPIQLDYATVGSALERLQWVTDYCSWTLAQTAYAMDFGGLLLPLADAARVGHRCTLSTLQTDTALQTPLRPLAGEH